MPQTRRIHWFAPVSMIGALIAGISFAVAHHFFYQSLNGMVVPEHDFLGSSFSRQQVNLAIGTAFAFLTKAALVTGLETLDDLYDAPSELLSLADLQLWLRFPTPLLLALVAWIIPLSSIVTPSTLSTRNVNLMPVPVEQRFVPRLDFDSLSFVSDLMPYGPVAADTPTAAYGTGYSYQGPNQAVLSSTSAVMANGAIQPINPPAANSSWVLNFTGPALKCWPAAEDHLLRVRKNIAQYIHSPPSAPPPRMSYYLGWYKYYNTSDSPLDVPYAAMGNNTWDFLYGTPDDVFWIFVASDAWRDRATNTSLEKSDGDAITEAILSGTLPDWLSESLLECRLFNSSYDVAFTYAGGMQFVEISSTNIEPNAPMKLIVSVLGPRQDEDQQLRPFECFKAPANYDDPGEYVPCVTEPDVLRTLSYQAVMDAFLQPLYGPIQYYANSITQDAKVLTTTLSHTQELSRMPGRETSLQQLSRGRYPMLSGNEQNLADQSDTPSLREAIEDLFQNVTVSLLTQSALLRTNHSDLTSRVPVTLPAHRTVYAYSFQKLCIAYGIAVIISALATMVGLITILLNNASYSSDFSTIFRAARGATVGSPMDERDLTGCDPLPKDLKRAQIHFRRQGLRARHDSVMELGNGKDWDASSDQVPLMPLTSPSASLHPSSAASFRLSTGTISPTRPTMWSSDTSY